MEVLTRALPLMLLFCDGKMSPFLYGPPAVLSFRALHDPAPVRLAHSPFPGRAALAGSQFLSFASPPTPLLILTSGLKGHSEAPLTAQSMALYPLHCSPSQGLFPGLACFLHSIHCNL